MIINILIFLKSSMCCRGHVGAGPGDGGTLVAIEVMPGIA